LIQQVVCCTFLLEFAMNPTGCFKNAKISPNYLPKFHMRGWASFSFAVATPWKSWNTFDILDKPWQTFLRVLFWYGPWYRFRVGPYRFCMVLQWQQSHHPLNTTSVLATFVGYSPIFAIREVLFVIFVIIGICMFFCRYCRDHHAFVLELELLSCEDLSTDHL